MTDVTEYQTVIEALDAAPGERPFVTHWRDQDDQVTVTFDQFRTLAHAQAGSFFENGVRYGDRVIIIMPQEIAAMTAFVGAMMLGAPPAFLAYPNFKIEPAKYRTGLAGVTRNLGARVVVIDEHFPEDLLGHIAVDGAARILRCAAPSNSAVPPRVKIAEQDIAFIQHSAGTTGLQKGVALQHGAVLRQIEHLQQALAIDAHSDRIYSWLPLYHDMGLIACFILPLVCHLPVVMQSPVEWVMQPEAMLAAVTEHRSTLAWMPNFAFQFVRRRIPSKRWADYDLSSLRALINCSEPVRESSLQEFRSAFGGIGLRPDALRASYAMAENVFAVTQSNSSPSTIRADTRAFRSEHLIRQVPADTAPVTTFTSSGTLLEGQSVRIVNDTGSPLAEGHVGEILIQSDCLFDGYYNRPDLTCAAMVDGWYRTGDLGFLTRGELFVVGRKKDLLIVGGENLYPQDIEEAVATHAAIHDGRVVALGIFNRELGTEDVVIVAEVEDNALLAQSDRLERELAAVVVATTGIAPRRVILKAPKWIVKSTAGKPSRSATREKLIAEHPEFNGDSSL